MKGRMINYALVAGSLLFVIFAFRLGAEEKLRWEIKKPSAIGFMSFKDFPKGSCVGYNRLGRYVPIDCKTLKPIPIAEK